MFLLLYIDFKNIFQKECYTKYFNIFKYTYLINDMDVELRGMAASWE